MATQATSVVDGAIEYGPGNPGVKFVTMKFTSDNTTTGDATAFVAGTFGGVKGYRLHSIRVTGGVTADSEVGPTANLELTIADSTTGFVAIDPAVKGLNIVDGDDSANYALAEDTTHLLFGPLTITIGAGNVVDDAAGAVTRVTMAFIPEC